MAANVDLILERAHAERQRSNWFGAQKLYETAAGAVPGNPQIHHNLALCLYARGEHRSAFEHAQIATRHAPQLAQAWVLRAKIERALGAIDTAEKSLLKALEAARHQPNALLELADLTLNELGDARAARRLVAPLLHHPEYGEDARLAMLMAKFYDRDESAEALTAAIRAFSSRYLRLRNFRFTAERRPRSAGRKAKKRIGLLSPLFCVSPVYFFTIGALSLLADEVEFVVLNRGTRSDWATDRFRGIAREWHAVAHLPAQVLANSIYGENLDALVDLGGWCDPVALKALSAKPAPRMYKWVGGQSCTTGLEAFDGFLSDAEQTPPECARLYSEPLVILETGYVTYTPPHYMPAPAARKSFRYGVIGNPVKITTHLRERIAGIAPDDLIFVDRRYGSARVREAVCTRLGLEDAQFRYIAPANHAEYLAAVSRIETILDTVPYNGGLTAIEGLALNAELVYTPGVLFMERHTASHAANFRSRARQGRRQEAHHGSRYDHAALARSLKSILVHGRP